MLHGKIPIYILPSLNLSSGDKEAVLDTIAEAGPITEEVPHDDSIQTTSDAIRHTKSALDEENWDHDYIIIVDRPGWKSTEKDGVLVVRTDFKGEVDGLRMPTCDSAINISSMSIGNTDWEEYIATARSKYTWDRQTHFAVYVDSSIDDVDDALDFGLPLIDAGLRGRKAQQGSVCCVVEDERPSDVEELGRYHGAVAGRLGCNERIGCFVEIENWGIDDARVRVFQLDDGGSLDSFLVEVELAGEVMGSVAMGLSGWEEEKSKYTE